MPSTHQTVSNPSRWAGRIASALPALFLLFGAVIHMMKIPPVVDAFAQLGYPLSVAVPLGIVELVCLALYAIPQTSVLGAILLTGYLGGAVATHVRVGAGLFPVLFPVILGVLFWGGLLLRDQRLRALIPWRAAVAVRSDAPRVGADGRIHVADAV